MKPPRSPQGSGVGHGHGGKTTKHWILAFICPDFRTLPPEDRIGFNEVQQRTSDLTRRHLCDTEARRSKIEISPKVAPSSLLQVAGAAVLARVTDAGVDGLLAVLSLHAHKHKR